jgi:hypothetical protein
MKKMQEDIAKQKNNITKATHAIARSNSEWTKEMGIDDPDLINSLRISIKDRRWRYEKETAELLKQLAECEKKLAKLDDGPLEKEKDPSDHEEHSAIVDNFKYNDSFCEIIEAARAVAHLVCFPISRSYVNIANIIPAS